MQHILLGAALALSLLSPGLARAETAGLPASAAAIRELAQVPLRAPVNHALPEQWEDRPTEGKGVRNVVDPTLTPVLPALDKANGLAVIVAPGGGFVNLAFDNEGLRVARHLAEQGIAAFVLKYRVNPTPRDDAAYQKHMAAMMSRPRKPGEDVVTTPPEAVEDALAAVKLVRARAGEWKVDPAKVGMIGFSAGAMTTLGAGVAPEAAARPDFIAPIYGPRDPGPVPADAPPMFLAIALDDPLFQFDATTGLINKWRAAGRPIEVHLYEKGGHGFGMRPRSEATGQWTGQFVAWMKDRGLMLPAAERKAYELQTMKLGTMLDNPAMNAILTKHMPALTAGPGSQMARSLSLRELAGFAPQLVPADKLPALLAELATVQ